MDIELRNFRKVNCFSDWEAARRYTEIEMECVRFLGMYHKKITFSQMKEGDIVINIITHDLFFYQNAELLRGKKICFNLKTKIYISGSYPSKNGFVSFVSQPL